MQGAGEDEAESVCLNPKPKLNPHQLASRAEADEEDEAKDSTLNPNPKP